MANQERTFEAGGKTFTIRFTQNSIYKLQREVGRPLLRKPGEELADQQLMLQAGLEGFRLKNKSRPKPFTLEEVGDILDDMRAEGLVPFEIIAEAWEASFPIVKPNDEEGAETENPSTAAAK